VSALRSVEDALAQVLASASPLRDTVTTALPRALGHYLAEYVTSPIAVPAEDNSAMDGYALRAADACGPLPVSQRIPAGSVGAPLEPGTAARIFTGAPVPPGADTVVMQENCLEADGVVTVEGEVEVGQNIRPRGQDIAVGATVLPRGRRLRPQDLGLLASVGRDKAEVYRPLRVAVLSTGDELIEPGAGAPEPGQRFNSNRYTLAGLVSSLGMEWLDGGIVRDDPEETARALLTAAGEADCVITSGGVSVGEEDHVKNQVERLGRLELWKLAIKPGKPLAFGRIGDTPLLGLPGNPTSVFVTFCLIARPFLLKLQGATELDSLVVPATARFATRKPGTRQEYIRVDLKGTERGLEAIAYPEQSSGVLSSVSASRGLAIIPPGTLVSEGDSVRVLLLDLLA
jgi:molybdopterin molybdotransferase